MKFTSLKKCAEQVMSDLIFKNPKYFSSENKRFFQDISYWVMFGKKTGKAFMIRSTYGWSDMFDGIKKRHYRINPISEDLKIKPLGDRVFVSLQDVNEWIEEN